MDLISNQQILMRLFLFSKRFLTLSCPNLMRSAFHARKRKNPKIQRTMYLRIFFFYVVSCMKEGLAFFQMLYLFLRQARDFNYFRNRETEV